LVKIADTVSILAQGMVTAVGSNGKSTCAAMRAGVSGIGEANLWDFTVGENLVAGRPQMHQWWEGAGMLVELLAPAVTQCLDAAVDVPDVGRTVDPQKIPIVIILPPPDRPHRAPDLSRLVLDTLGPKLGFSLPKGSCAVTGGRTGIATALEQAVNLMANSGMCVIAGVESFLRQVLVEHYINEERLFCGVNSNGFIPGEAACAVLVGSSGSTSGPELIIRGIGAGLEPAGTGGDAETIVTGAGLTLATKQALSAAGIEYSALEFTISDLNGERFKFKEVVISQARLDRLPPEGVPLRKLGYLDMWHPIEFIGEVGAAIFPCILGWAFEAGCKNYARGAYCLLHASEDAGPRVAIVTQFKPGGGV